MSQNQWHWLVVFSAFFILYIPTYIELYNTVWLTDEQGHGPIVLLVSLFLLWSKRGVLFDIEAGTRAKTVGYALLLFGLFLYVLGRSQSIQLFDVGSQVIVLSSIILIGIGLDGLKKLWFPLFFLIFMIPLPGTIVDALTLPMKIAVSNLSEFVLYHLDYPIARDGVILQIGYYKLLVADACAGLHTVFSLEAMGLLYLHLIKRDSLFRNILLGLLIIPISFFANTIRVISLVLITYYYGDEVGQGFVHDFAGFVLFGTALVLIIFVDVLIQKIEVYKQAKTSISGVNQ